MLLRLDGLVQAVAESSSDHQTASELIDNQNFSVANNVVNVPFHDVMSLQSLKNVVVNFHILRVTEVFDTKESLSLAYAGVCQRNLLILFVYDKVASRICILFVNLLTSCESLNKTVRLLI